MRKTLGSLLLIVLLTSPLVASAATQMVQPVKPASLTIMPVFYSYAPAFMLFIVHDPSGTESIDFGDGHRTGENCVFNALGWCDLSQIVGHRYDYPGQYTVRLYSHTSHETYQLLSTSSVTVFPR